MQENRSAKVRREKNTELKCRPTKFVSTISFFFFLEFLFRHLVRLHELALAGGVELQREKEGGFQLVRRPPITRSVENCRIRIDPVAQLHNIALRRAAARVEVFEQMLLAQL